ncbi:NAD-dependent epimerase/dehydratase family protein [Bradymonas sediminis]|uniref:NAD-dependent epimerase/dehydratase domain-containing protein n=1 Tax=Bradymonas sediminis TaxID=1548548 RepID=A0A2Z4FRG0_9DELT|nr:NAD-dependent epimerase/dehydratase family protein [Bradymonas sediminis]AWV91246.1 hypothetical protein DN745_18700 [Bradymonas sediminis]
MSISNPTEPKTIVVAGASGFIGRALPDAFDGNYRLVGLSRQVLEEGKQNEALDARDYTWRRCDLFSRQQSAAALGGADLAVYLVHSMRPSSALTQGHFSDMDLICADNFARAARRHGVEHIVYISGQLPDPEALGNQPINQHLATRLEVEQTLASYGAAVTTLRAGIVLGPGGDLSELIFRLVERLPVMLLPKWAEQSVSPIARADLVALVRFVLEHPEYAGESWDVGGAETLTWAALLARAAEQMGRNRSFYRAPVMMPVLSTAWITMVTGLPGAMIRPMVESLRQGEVPRDFELQRAAGQTPISLDAAMRASLASRRKRTGSNAAANDVNETSLVPSDAPREVRSVQRLPMPAGKDARWIATTYAEWLPRFLRPFIDVRLREGRWLDFLIRPLPWPILSMELATDISKPDRQLYWIRGGMLAGDQRGERIDGRLEFREALGGKWALAAIHNFRPRLPWPIYMLTQAKMHLFVMNAFARYLGRLSSTQRVFVEGDTKLDEAPHTQNQTVRK